MQDVAEEAPVEETLLELQDFLPHRLNVLSSLVSQALTRVYGQYGIGIPEWRVLVTLGQFGVMTGKAIGAQTHMHKTKVSRAVAQLEQRKYWPAGPTERTCARRSCRSRLPGAPVYEELGAARARVHRSAVRGRGARRPGRLRPCGEAADGTLGQLVTDAGDGET